MDAVIKIYRDNSMEFDCGTTYEAERLARALRDLGCSTTVTGAATVAVKRPATAEVRTEELQFVPHRPERNERVFVAALQGLAANASFVPTAARGDDAFANRLVGIARSIVRACYNNSSDAAFDPVGVHPRDVMAWKSYRYTAAEAKRFNRVEFRAVHTAETWVGDPNALPPNMNVSELDWRPTSDSVKSAD